MIFTNVKAEYKVEYHYVKDVKDYQEVKNFKVNTNKQVTLVYEKEKLQEVPKESPIYVPKQNETKAILSMRNKKIVLENGKLVIYHYNNIISRSIMHIFT